MKSIKFFAALAIFAVSFTSCKKDKENPTVSITMPEQHSNFKWGEKVHIEADLSDDRSLKHLHSFIGDANGNHLHNFGYMITIQNIGEESYHFHEHFTVPDSAPSMAWVYFELTDAEDKLTEIKWMLHFEE